MKTVFVDANVFLRFLTTDSEGQQERAEALFRKAAAEEIALVTGPPILFEVAWTLKAGYRLPKSEVLSTLSAIAAVPGLTLVDDDLVTEAIALAQQTGSEFADAYIAVAALKFADGRIATFNRKHFQRLGVDLTQM